MGSYSGYIKEVEKSFLDKTKRLSFKGLFFANLIGYRIFVPRSKLNLRKKGYFEDEIRKPEGLEQ